jgi:hypothetical protein
MVDEENAPFPVRSPLRQAEGQVSGHSGLCLAISLHSGSVSNSVSDQKNSDAKRSKKNFTIHSQQRGGLQTRHKLLKGLSINICEPCENYEFSKLGRTTSFEETPTSFASTIHPKAKPCQKMKCRRLFLMTGPQNSLARMRHLSPPITHLYFLETIWMEKMNHVLTGARKPAISSTPGPKLTQQPCVIRKMSELGQTFQR